MRGEIESFDYPGDYPAQDLGLAGRQPAADPRRAWRRPPKPGSGRLRLAVGGDAGDAVGRPRAGHGRDLSVPLGQPPLCQRSLWVRRAGQRRLCLHRQLHADARHRAHGPRPAAPPRPWSRAHRRPPRWLARARSTATNMAVSWSAFRTRFGDASSDALPGQPELELLRRLERHGYPRIGMEVLVEFLEGDPDKPVVVGNVFNGKEATRPMNCRPTRRVQSGARTPIRARVSMRSASRISRASKTCSSMPRRT